MEQVIKSRIPGLQSLISKTINELETELSRLGRPVATDAGVSVPFYLWFDYSYSSFFILFLLQPSDWSRVTQSFNNVTFGLLLLSVKFIYNYSMHCSFLVKYH